MKTSKHRGPAIFIIACGLLVLAVAGAFFLYRTPGAPGQGEEVRFLVERGVSASEIAASLEKAGLIRNSRVFLIVARLSGSDSRFQAGSYRIAKGTPMGEIVRTIAEGRQSLEKVLVPEGYTARMIAALFAEKGICPPEEFLAATTDPGLAKELGIPAKSLEGYLYPDTYFVSSGTTGADLARLMVNAFKTKIAALPGLRGMDAQTLHETVTLASIVEREYRVASEAPLIASVFLNRMRIGMALQSCATVVYVITEKQGKPHPEVVRLADLKIADPYNTYLHRGLPPGPISNPGMTALAAVSEPAKSEYLYFRLADAEKGVHRFSRTLEEHANTSLPVKGF
ncbi:MAG: endolytic transglycosylase MltG [Rectinemataceae bacterium]